MKTPTNYFTVPSIQLSILEREKENVMKVFFGMLMNNNNNLYICGYSGLHSVIRDSHLHHHSDHSDDDEDDDEMNYG